MAIDHAVTTAFYHLHHQAGEQPSPLTDPHLDLNQVRGSRVMYSSGVGEITEHPLYQRFKTLRIYAARYNARLRYQRAAFSCNPGREAEKQALLEQQLLLTERHAEIVVTQATGQPQPAITLYRPGESLQWAMGWLKRNRGNIQRLELYVVQKKGISYLPWSYSAGSAHQRGNGAIVKFPRTQNERDQFYRRRMAAALRDSNQPGRRANMITHEQRLATIIERMRNPSPQEPRKPRTMDLFPVPPKKRQ